MLSTHDMRLTPETPHDSTEVVESWRGDKQIKINPKVLLGKKYTLTKSTVVSSDITSNKYFYSLHYLLLG